MTGWWRVVTPGSWVLRAVVLVAPVLALLSTAVDLSAPRLLLTVLVTALAAAGAVRPESALLTVAIGLVVCWWALAARDQTPPTVVLAAWLLLAAHVCATLLSYGPRELEVDPALVRLWARRTLVLAVAPPVLWLLADAVAGRPEPRDIWVAGLVAAIVVCLVGALAVSDRGSGAGDEATPARGTGSPYGWGS